MVDQPRVAPSPRLPVPVLRVLATTHPTGHDNKLGDYKTITENNDLIYILESHRLRKGIGYFVGDFSLFLNVIHDVMNVVYITARSSTKYYSTYKFTVILWFPQGISIYSYRDY